ncbi:hypothetical protein MA16_Dca018352 [Dendrobium catenatum]|uniref:Uncharacterized protein n=1 Tax=Dendrobium catenatum TaxID=906689 RepID=A0A2I0VWQ4_9ASPA|nr:hypothetical protein MA16_Dca018352 [Dendrobium catenatum]
MKWLQKLGKSKIDWKALTMEFKVEGRRVIIRGNPSLSKTMISLKTMVRTIQGERVGFLVEL